jgi:tetratricopeptide (TPR) repeat protein/transcriptional regulator with XRE-family HTH domain
VARENQDRKKERDQLRDNMLAKKRTYEQIATAMIEQFGDRRRPAWRNAHGWTQDEVAVRFNEFVGDEQASMTGNRISDFERWPSSGGRRPNKDILAILAEIYGTTLLDLVDNHDRQNMTLRELAGLTALEKQILTFGNTRRSRLTLAYASSVDPPHQLPTVSPYFVGRTHELDMLTAQLDNVTEGSPVVITAIGGTAGIGKTALAVQWAQKHSEQFPDGQLYVNLRGFHPTGTPMTPQEAIRGFLDALHVPVEKIPASLDAQAALYRNLVKSKNLLIVLDNARDADQVRPLLPNSPTCMMLVTSRQQLNSLADESEGATRITLGLLTTEEAHQLLIEILGPKRIQAEPEAVGELIHRCVHLPIALRIAARRIEAEPHTSLNVLVSQLREQRQRLAALSTGDSQHFDIRAVFSWSYTALSSRAARLFRLLGLHPGPDINLYAAASLAGLPEHDSRSVLSELTRAHLLEEHAVGRYQFHDLLSTYAVEEARLEENEPQQQAALHRVLDYYLYTSIAALRYLNPYRKPITLEIPQPEIVPHQITSYEHALEWFTAEHTVLLAAINHAAASGFDAHAWQLPWVLVTFLYRRGHWRDYTATQQIAVAAADRLGNHTAKAHAHRELGHAYTHLGRYADALTCLQQALTFYLNLDDPEGQARTHLALSLVYERQDQLSQTLIHAQYTLDLSYACGNHAWQARALNVLGWSQTRLGNHQQALAYCQKALELYRNLDDRVGVAETLDSLGYTHHHLGHHDEAITHYQQSHALWREIGDYYNEAEILTHLADTYRATDNVTAAGQAWRQALTILERLGHPDVDTIHAKLAALDSETDTNVNGNQVT